MDGKDGAGARRDCRLHQRRIDAEGVRLDIHKNGLRAGEQDRVGRGDECEWNGDDFVAGADSVREERQVKAGGARGDRHRVRNSTPARELLLELRDHRALRELAALEHEHDGALLLLPNQRMGERDGVFGLGRFHDGLTDPSGPQTYVAPSWSQTSWFSPCVRRRRAQTQTCPIGRAGLPATSAWSATSRVTTAPAATSAHRPTVIPATSTAPAPREAPVRTRILASSQSSALLIDPSALMARGYLSFVKQTCGPTKTPSSTVAPG